VLAAVAPGGDLYVRAMEFTCDGPAERSTEECARHLAFELEETFRFLSVRQRIRQVTRVYVCGGGALISGLKESIAAILGVESAVDPLANIRTQGDARPLRIESGW
jgi:Tfp pilus assembly PilM family ATPase